VIVAAGRAVRGEPDREAPLLHLGNRCDT
jgi:hypothetical protein